ncbi:BglG family transcription antiterminator [Calorimonas adulescens]|uniref:BglG family transcription antiterminator n=1 Tax=Calorimonas adulescens TaxID=2606906 RepID=A0A5D8QFI3_9THEO|nr:BglG family transcription antiterminator [Calorimonas adulescens]TZE82959.1 BglG family transcription antiterminator [Calorimonas adulescens]
MQLDTRCIDILNYLLETDKPATTSKLAEVFKVSTRTIRYDLDRIDDWLKENNISPVERKPNTGVYLREKKSIADALSSINYYEYGPGRLEREDILKALILKARDEIKIDELAEKLYVSRNTVINDLKNVRDWFKRFNINIKPTKNGLKVIGKEKDIRRAAIELLTDEVDTAKILEYLEGWNFGPGAGKEMSDFISEEDTKFLSEVLREAERELGYRLSDMDFSGLILHLAIAVKRIKLGRNIMMPHEEIKQLQVTKEFAVASQIASCIESHYGIEVPIEEMGYITLHLLGSKSTTAVDIEKENWLDVEFMTSELIKKVEEELKVDLEHDDILFKGLKEHLTPTLYRIKNDLPVKNPLLDDVKANYPKLFKAVEKAVKIVENYAGKRINEDEIGYISFHFGAALERMRSKRSIRAVLVCSTGLGTARLLATRVMNEFENIIIEDITSYHGLKELKTDADIIISTINLKDTTLPYVRVSPMLAEEDIDSIKRILREIYIKPEPINGDKLEQVIKAIKRYAIVTDEAGLKEELSRIIAPKIPHLISREVRQPVLNDLLTEKTIKLNVEVDNWEEAIREGGKLLLEAGKIEARYIDAMIKTAKQLGPYIVIAPGIAMPHARPEDGVKEVGMSLITLRTPVNFGHRQNDPVKIVVCLCAVDNNSHIKALSQLVKFLSSEDVQSVLIKDINKERVIDYIIKYSS